MEYEKITIGDKVYRLMPEDDYEADCMLALAAGAEPERARTGYERVGVGDEYFSNLFPKGARKTNDNSDSSAYACGDYANDKQLYDDNERAIEIYRRMRQWQALNDEPAPPAPMVAWYICYDFDEDKLKYRHNDGIRTTFVVYFSEPAKAEEALEAFRDDLIWLHTQYRRRLDEPKRN